MAALPLAIPQRIQTVAIVDDDSSEAEIASWEVEEAGFEPLIIQGPLRDIGSLVDYMTRNAQGALCDHRLAPRGMASFYGASVVAALYDRGLPAILVTQYKEIDMDVSIRKWRHKIPVLLSRDEANPDSIRSGIIACAAELSGNIPAIRKSHRVVLRIVEITQESNETVVDVMIPSWNPHKGIRLPISLIPNELHSSLVIGVHLIAFVNIGAEHSEDVYFRQFELALPPEDNDGLA